MGDNRTLRIYWDACCFISILNKDEHAERCLQVLEEAERGDVQLVVSSLTMGEVVRPKGSATPLPREKREQVLAFFEQDYIALVNLDREIVRLSLDLCWDHGFKSRDALHIAAAKAVRCDVFETHDVRLLKLGEGIEGIVFRKPVGAGQSEMEFD